MASGGFYDRLKVSRAEGGSAEGEELEACVENTVAALLSSETDARRPGMLLGKIQSGKTRAFLGIIASAFDNGFDVAVVLTKGTAQRTGRRAARGWYAPPLRAAWHGSRVRCGLGRLPQPASGRELPPPKDQCDRWRGRRPARPAPGRTRSAASRAASIPDAPSTGHPPAPAHSPAPPGPAARAARQCWWLRGRARAP